MGYNPKVSSVLLVLLFGQSLLGPPPVQAQLDGSFWWTNVNLIRKVEEYREEKDVKAVVVNNETEIDSVRLRDNTFTDATDDSPDCICVPSDRCRSTADGKQGRDGLCGSGNTCCRRNHIIQQQHHHVPVLPPSPHEQLLPASLHTPSDPISSDNPSLPDHSLLSEISSLLQEFNGPDQIEPDAEFIFDVVPATSTTTTTTTRPRPSTTTKTITTRPPTKPTTTTRTYTAQPRPTPAKLKKCGQRRPVIASRVHFQDEDESIEEHLSGTVNFGEFPWTVYIEERIANGSFLYKCGGALLTSNVVVTAGHCVANARNNPENFRVTAGDWDRRHTHEKISNQQRTILRIVLHPSYYSGSLYNDIAILVFSHPLNESFSNVGNVCLPTTGDNFYGSNCLLSGWGASPRNPNQEEPIQRFVSMPLMQPQVCEARVQADSSLGRRFKMHESFLCAGGTPGLDSCKGSGGSPLVCEKGGAYVLAGLMSWGVSCGQGVPGVYASVTYQTRWINEVIDGMEDNVVYFI